MLATTGSSEIAEWIAELKLRAKEIDEAAKKPPEAPAVFGG